MSSKQVFIWSIFVQNIICQNTDLVVENNETYEGYRRYLNNQPTEDGKIRWPATIMSKLNKQKQPMSRQLMTTTFQAQIEP